MCMNPSAEVLDAVRQKGYAITTRDFFQSLDEFQSPWKLHSAEHIARL